MLYLCSTSFSKQLEPGTLSVNKCVCTKAWKSHTACLFPLPGARLVLRSKRMGRNWNTGPANVHTETHSHAASWCTRLCAGCGDRVNRLSPNRLVEKMDSHSPWSLCVRINSRTGHAEEHVAHTHVHVHTRGGCGTVLGRIIHCKTRLRRGSSPCSCTRHTEEITRVRPHSLFVVISGHAVPGCFSRITRYYPRPPCGWFFRPLCFGSRQQCRREHLCTVIPGTGASLNIHCLEGKFLGQKVYARVLVPDWPSRSPER